MSNERKMQATRIPRHTWRHSSKTTDGFASIRAVIDNEDWKDGNLLRSYNVVAKIEQTAELGACVLGKELALVGAAPIFYITYPELLNCKRLQERDIETEVFDHAGKGYLLLSSYNAVFGDIESYSRSAIAEAESFLLGHVSRGGAIIFANATDEAILAPMVGMISFATRIDVK